MFDADVVAAVDQVSQLTDVQREQFTSALGLTTPKTRDRLYLIVVGAFAIVLVGAFATLATGVFVKTEGGVSPELILTTFTSVVGFLAGLFAPSPVSQKTS